MSKPYVDAASIALQVLESIRATSPETIADHMPPDWGMNRLRVALQTPPQDAAERHFCVDGHEFADSESNWMGDGQFPPFAVFDIDAQKNLQPYYATRKQAEMAMDRLMLESREQRVLESVGRDALLAEVNRRGLLTELHGAVGALYDNLATNGVLDAESDVTSYLAYRLRREDAKLGDPNGTSIEFWQQKIDALDSKGDRPAGQRGG